MLHAAWLGIQEEDRLPNDNSGESGTTEPRLTLDRTNLKTQMVDVLRTAIFSGQMTPGTTYNAGELAARYGASRTPVREAILELESKGLVTVVRGVGFTVSVPSAAEMRDVMEIRRVLESWSMAQIAGKLSAEAIATARKMVDRIESAAHANDLVSYWALDREFHSFLVQQVGNARLTQLLAELRDTQRIPVLAEIATAGNLPTRNADHRALLDAVEAGEPEQAADLIRRHIDLNLGKIEDDSTTAKS